MLKLKPNCLLSVRIKAQRALLLCLERIPHHVRKSQDEIEVDEPACYFPTWQDR
jgi:hypothetical protein